MTDQSAPTIDAAELRRAFSCFPSGVTAVCALVDGAPVGMAASSFTSVSLEPALVSVCVTNTSNTWMTLRTARHIGVSVLAAGQGEACRSLAAREGDRFAGVDWRSTVDGAVLVGGATAQLTCTLHSELEAGDHHIALLEVHDIVADPSAEPLVFHASAFCRIAR